MIPLRSVRSGPKFTPIVVLLVVICIAVTVRLASLPGQRASAIMGALAIVPVRLLGRFSIVEGTTLISSAFLHAGWIHLAGNLLFLAVFGPAVESRLGWRGFSALYLICGVAGGLAYALTHTSSTVPLVGASGAIAGVLGAHLILEPRARVTTLVPAFVIFEIASLPAAFVIALWFVLQVAATVAPIAGTSGAHVAWIAHTAGFVAGVLLACPAAAKSALRRRRSLKRRTKYDARVAAKRAA